MMKYYSHLLRTSFHAVLATDASLFVYKHHALRCCISSSRRADSLAWSVFAMIALEWNVFLVIGRVFTSFLVLYPVEGFRVIESILILTGNPAGMAPYAFCGIYGNSISWHFNLQ